MINLYELGMMPCPKLRDQETANEPIGVLGNINGNDVALRSVADWLKNKGVNKLVISGNLFGFLPFSSDCIDILSEFKWTLLKGLWEEIVTGERPLIELGSIGTEIAKYSLREIKNNFRLRQIRQCDDEINLYNVRILTGGYIGFLIPSVNGEWMIEDIRRNNPFGSILLPGRPGTSPICYYNTDKNGANVVCKRELNERFCCDLHSDCITIFGSVGINRHSPSISRFCVIENGHAIFQAINYPLDDLKAKLVYAGLDQHAYCRVNYSGLRRD